VTQRQRVCSIERAAGGAPTSFCIWRAGQVATDLGNFLFSDRSAQMLMADQAKRGVAYPFDLDHLSLNPSAPEHTRRAVGWHSLEVRNGDLWAVRCTWSADVQRSLEQRPPAWRFYSPVFFADEETGEITRYVGCALTNTPATHHPTDFAIAASLTANRNLMNKDVQHALATIASHYGHDAAQRVALAIAGHPPTAAGARTVKDRPTVADMDPTIARAMGLLPPTLPESDGVIHYMGSK
jgi:phage I-like protein